MAEEITVESVGEALKKRRGRRKTVTEQESIDALTSGYEKSKIEGNLPDELPRAAPRRSWSREVPRNPAEMAYMEGKQPGTPEFAERMVELERMMPKGRGTSSRPFVPKTPAEILYWQGITPDNPKYMQKLIELERQIAAARQAAKPEKPPKPEKPKKKTLLEEAQELLASKKQQQPAAPPPKPGLMQRIGGMLGFGGQTPPAPAPSAPQQMPAVAKPSPSLPASPMSLRAVENPAAMKAARDAVVRALYPGRRWQALKPEEKQAVADRLSGAQ